MRRDVCWLIVLLSVSAGCLVAEAKPSPNPERKPTLWNSIPGISQAKMAFLYVIGDSEEAKQTWNNFKNMSHLWEEVKELDNSIPGYGQVKAIIVELDGDKERAVQIAIQANKATFIVGGLILGGPAGAGPMAGAIAGAVAADAASSVIFQKPVGVIDHSVHIQNKTASEHIDAVLDLTLLATPALGAKGKTTLGTRSNHNVHFRMEKQTSVHNNPNHHGHDQTHQK